MELFLVKKRGGRRYDSRQLLERLLAEKGFCDLVQTESQEGKPLLVDPAGGSPLHCSISHTKSAWFCLLDHQGPLGLDAEEVGRKVQSATARSLHPLEQACLAALEPGSGEWQELFLELWTRKEACLKLWGLGLAGDLSSFSVVDQEGFLLTEVRREGVAQAFLVGSRAEGHQLALAACRPLDLPPLRRLPYGGQPKRSAADQAAAYLAGRDHTEKELADKLARAGHEPEAIGQALEDLKSWQYLDDQRLGISYAREALARGRGRQRIERELVEKGLDAAAAAAAFQEAAAGGESEEERACALARQLLARGAPGEEEAFTQAQAQKAGRRLAALGYDSAVIYRVLDRLRPDA